MKWSDLAKILAISAASSFAKAAAGVAKDKAEKSSSPWKAAGWGTLGGTLDTVSPIADALIPVLMQPAPAAPAQPQLAESRDYEREDATQP